MLDFSDYITERTKDFTGRKWVFTEIDRWLATGKGVRFFLLTGEPGSGKTAIAARLLQFSTEEVVLPAGLQQFSPNFLSAVHFCRAGAGDWVDPRTFAKSVSLQLAKIQEFALALKDVGDKEVNIHVQQQVGTAHEGTKLEAVHIENLDIGRLTGLEAFNRTVLDPLRIIADQNYQQPITIIIDSLDEALTYTGDTTIVDLLSNLPEVNLQLRILATSRQEPRVENRLRDAAGLFLSDPTYTRKNDSDIATYVAWRMEHDEKLAPKVAALAPTQVSALPKTIADKAEGNFQYVVFLLNSLSNGQRPLDNLEGLPYGLDGLYHDSLERVLKLVKRTWKTVEPLLGVLSVAQEPLTLDQLRAFSRQRRDIWGVMGDLQQFTETVTSTQMPFQDIPLLAIQEDVEDRYRLYHQSFVDFLHRQQLIVGRKKLHNLYYLSPDDFHKQVVAYYGGTAGKWAQIDWERVDGYGLRHLVTHLYYLQGVNGYREKLHTLLQTDTFIERRLQESPNPVLDDLLLALDLALQNNDLTRVWQHILRYRSILHEGQNFQHFTAMVKTGQFETALDRIALHAFLPNAQALSRLWIAWEAAARGQPQKALTIAQQALDRLPPRGIVRVAVHQANPEAADYTGDAIGEALQRLLMRIAKVAKPTLDEQKEWLGQAVDAWPVYAAQQLIERLPEHMDFWGKALDADQMHAPMPELLNELKDRAGRIDADANFREAVFFFQRQLAAGLFNSRHEPGWLDYVRRTVDLVALDDYPSYREMALAWVAAAVLAQADEELSRSALAIILGGMFKPSPGFWGDSIAAALGGLNQENQQEPEPRYLLGLLEEVEAKNERGVDPTVPRKPFEIVQWREKIGLPTDPWSFRIRRRSAVAAVLYRHGNLAGAEGLLREAGTEGHKGSYAGFRALARLSLSCRWLEWQMSSEAIQQVEAARVDANNMLDEVLKQERRDLVNKMHNWISQYSSAPATFTEQAALHQVQQKIGLERLLYIEFLSAVWHDDDARLTRLLPLALDDATTTDAVLGRLLGIRVRSSQPDKSFLHLVRVMNLGKSLED